MILKIRHLLFLTILFLCLNNVHAKDYMNQNGVNLTTQEYEFISKVFYDGFQDIMTIDDYNNIFENNTIDEEIKIITYVPYANVAIRGTAYESASKKLTIATVCGSTCLVTMNAVWTASPNVRSYDVIGAYLDEVELYNTPTTTVANSTGSNRSNEIIEKANGFGVSISLLSSGTDMQISQYYRVTTGGHVYASYQHAKKTISLSNSKKYEISRSGYGGVFLFDSGYSDYYDAMRGVDIAV